MQISEERETELLSYWNDETNDDESLEWRNDLTAEELQLVESWDCQYDKSMGAVYKRICEMSQEFEEKQANIRKDM